MKHENSRIQLSQQAHLILDRGKPTAKKRKKEAPVPKRRLDAVKNCLNGLTLVLAIILIGIIIPFASAGIATGYVSQIENYAVRVRTQRYPNENAVNNCDDNTSPCLPYWLPGYWSFPCRSAQMGNDKNYLKTTCDGTDGRCKLEVTLFLNQSVGVRTVFLLFGDESLNADGTTSDFELKLKSNGNDYGSYTNADEVKINSNASPSSFGSGFFEVDLRTSKPTIQLQTKDQGSAVAGKFITLAAWHFYRQVNWVKTASTTDFSPAVSANFLTKQMPSPSYHTNGVDDDCILINSGQEMIITIGGSTYMNDLLIVAEPSYKLFSTPYNQYETNFYDLSDTVCSNKAQMPAYFSDVSVSYDEFGVGIWTALDTPHSSNSGSNDGVIPFVGRNWAFDELTQLVNKIKIKAGDYPVRICHLGVFVTKKQAISVDHINTEESTWYKDSEHVVDFVFQINNYVDKISSHSCVFDSDTSAFFGNQITCLTSNVSANTIIAKATIADDYDWSLHYRFISTRVYEPFIGIILKWEVSDSGYEPGALAATAQTNMNQDEPPVQNPIEIYVNSPANFDEILNGPLFFYTPTDYVFSVENITPWIDISAADRVNQQVTLTIRLSDTNLFVAGNEYQHTSMRLKLVYTDMEASGNSSELIRFITIYESIPVPAESPATNLSQIEQDAYRQSIQLVMDGTETFDAQNLANWEPNYWTYPCRSSEMVAYKHFFEASCTNNGSCLLNLKWYLNTQTTVKSFFILFNDVSLDAGGTLKDSNLRVKYNDVIVSSSNYGSGFYEVNQTDNVFKIRIVHQDDDDTAGSTSSISVAALHLYGQENWVKTASTTDFSPAVDANFLTQQMPSLNYHTNGVADDCILIDSGEAMIITIGVQKYINDLLIVAEPSYLDSSNPTDYKTAFYDFSDTNCSGKAFMPAYFSDVSVSYDEFGFGIWTALAPPQSSNSGSNDGVVPILGKNWNFAKETQLVNKIKIEAGNYPVRICHLGVFVEDTGKTAITVTPSLQSDTWTKGQSHDVEFFQGTDGSINSVSIEFDSDTIATFGSKITLTSPGNFPGTEIVVTATIDNTYDWEVHSRFNSARIDEPGIKIIILYMVTDGATYDSGVYRTPTYYYAMNEVDPTYGSATPIEVVFNDLVAFDLTLSGPSFSFIPTDYIFTIESIKPENYSLASFSTSWIDVASDKANEEVTLTFRGADADPAELVAGSGDTLEMILKLTYTDMEQSGSEMSIDKQLELKVSIPVPDEVGSTNLSQIDQTAYRQQIMSRLQGTYDYKSQVQQNLANWEPNYWTFPCRSSGMVAFKHFIDHNTCGGLGGCQIRIMTWLTTETTIKTIFILFNENTMKADGTLVDDLIVKVWNKNAEVSFNTQQQKFEFNKSTPMTLGSGFYEVQITTKQLAFNIQPTNSGIVTPTLSVAAFHLYGQENWVKTASTTDFSPAVDANFLTQQMPSLNYHTDGVADDCILIDSGQEMIITIGAQKYMNDLLIVAEPSYLDSSNPTDYKTEFYDFSDTNCSGKAFMPAYFSDVSVSYDEFGVGIWTALAPPQSSNSGSNDGVVPILGKNWAFAKETQLVNKIKIKAGDYPVRICHLGVFVEDTGKTAISVGSPTTSSDTWTKGESHVVTFTAPITQDGDKINSASCDFDSDTLAIFGSKITCTTSQSSTEILVTATIDNKYDWEAHSRFNSTRVDEPSIGIIILWTINDAASYDPGALIATYQTVMIEDVPTYNDDKYKANILAWDEFDLILSGPNFSFIPTDYIFSFEPAQSTSWIEVATQRANEEVAFTIKPLEANPQLKQKSGDIFPMKLKLQYTDMEAEDSLGFLEIDLELKVLIQISKYEYEYDQKVYGGDEYLKFLVEELGQDIHIHDQADHSTTCKETASQSCDEPASDEEISDPATFQVSTEEIPDFINEGGLEIKIPSLTEQQVQQLLTPVKDVQEEFLFTEIPLEARLTRGVVNVKEMVLRQRKSLKNKASARSFSEISAEARLGQFSSTGSLKMRFTAALEIPDGTVEKVNSNNLQNRRRLATGEKQESGLIQVYAVKAESDEQELEAPILGGWELISLDEDGFELSFNFSSPLIVSSGDEPDLLLVQLNFGDIKDKKDKNMQESILKYYPIPTQIATEDEAEKVQTTGKSVGSSSKVSVGSNFVVNIAMAGSLSQLWGMINGLQVVAQMPLYDVRSPGNVNEFTGFLSELSNFDLLDTESMNNEVFYIPEEDSVSLNFQNAGYDSTLAIKTLGTFFYMMLAMIILALIYIMLYILSKKFVCLEKIQTRLAKFIYFNGTIRFFMEGYMDVFLCCLMNLKHLDWSDKDLFIVAVSNWTAIVLVSFLVGAPILLIVLYSRNLQNLQKEEFQNKYGALIEGGNIEMKENQWTALLIPISFFVRRIAMCVILVFYIDFFWGQVALQLMTCTVMIIILQWSNLLDSKFATNMETFNEVITLFILYHLMCFSDFVPEPETRAEMGRVFIGIMCFYCIVHLYFMFGDVIRKLWNKIRSKYYTRKRKKHAAKMREIKLDIENRKLWDKAMITILSQKGLDKVKLIGRVKTHTDYNRDTELEDKVEERQDTELLPMPNQQELLSYLPKSFDAETGLFQY